MKKNKKEKRDNRIDVPTYLFPQSNEYAKEIIKEDKNNKKK